MDTSKSLKHSSIISNISKKKNYVRVFLLCFLWDIFFGSIFFFLSFFLYTDSRFQCGVHVLFDADIAVPFRT